MPSGIYKIANRLNGELYVGSAVDIRQRWWDHRKLLRARCHHSRKLQNAWDKYGENGFEFSVLLLCDESYLLFFEQRAFDTLKPEYNIAVTAGSNLGLRFEGRPLTEEHKAKIGSAHKGKKIADWHKERVSAAQRGRVHTPEHVEKCRLTRIGRTHSEETRRKMSESQKGRTDNRSEEGKARHRAAVIESNRLRTISDETRAKLSTALKGRKKSSTHRDKLSSATSRLLRDSKGRIIPIRDKDNGAPVTMPH